MKFGLHVHHETLLELLTEPIDNRVEYIKNHKPPQEVDLRLRLLRELTEEEVNQLPQGFILALRKQYEPAREKYKPELEAWHKKVCVPDCPWNGKTIFPMEVEA